MNTRQATKYNKLIGRIGNNYYFLDEIFKYDDNFQGATATVLEPVSQDEYERAKEPEELKERFRDIWMEEVRSSNTEEGLDDWAEDQDIEDDSLWDFSGYDNWDQLRAIGLSEEKYPVFTCTGGGRSFSKDMQWDELYDKELWAKIQEVEE